MRMRCNAKVFGRSPASAITVDRVHTAYAWVACREIGTSTEEVIPVAAVLTQPSTVLTPGDGDIAGAKKIFPPDVQHWALSSPDQLGSLRPTMPR